MVQNIVLKSGEKSILVAANNSSEFVKYLTQRFEKPVHVLSTTVKGIMNNFDSMEREGVVFRGDLLEWLWDQQGKTVKLEVK